MTDKRKGILPINFLEKVQRILNWVFMYVVYSFYSML